MAERIFVFGSNLAGRHGKGAALEARRNWGAIYGRGRGLQGRSYALPTKDGQLRPLPLDFIKEEIRTLLGVARISCTKEFFCTRFGCGLAGYTDEQIAGLLKGMHIPSNVILPDEWKKVLELN